MFEKSTTSESNNDVLLRQALRSLAKICAEMSQESSNRANQYHNEYLKGYEHGAATVYSLIGSRIELILSETRGK
jgi:hypothetical protein